MSTRRQRPNKPQVREQRPVSRDVATPAPQNESLDVLFQAQVSLESFSGPLPPPDTLAKYNEVVPGFAERLLLLYENQQRLVEEQTHHRQDMERSNLASEIWQAKWGLIFGFLVALTFLAAATWITLAGYPAAGTALGVIDLGALVGVFVYGSRSRRVERITKQRILVGNESPSDS